jgi:hypothetical protein
MSFFYEQPLTPSNGSFADGSAPFADLAKAARDTAWYADNMAASDAAIEDAYDRRNDEIFKATGQRLQNPYRQHFAAVRARAPTATYDFAKDWQDTVAKLQDNRPELAQQIRAHIPIEEDAKALAREAAQRFDVALSSRNDFAGKWAAILGGGFAGSLRDPIQLGTLMLGAGPGTARNTAVRVLEVAGKEAAVNGSVELVMQPIVQAWREEAGLDHGFDQAIFNVLTAAGMGGLFGGVLEGAATALRGAPAPSMRNLPPDVRGAWSAAEADAFMQAVRPAGVTPEQHDAHVLEALRFAEHQKEFAGVKPYKMATQGELKRPMNVVEFIASLGGLRDDNGELAARGLDIRKSMTRFGPFMRRKGEVVEGGGLFGDAGGVRGKGLTADDLREKLVEAGYLNDTGRLTGGEASTSANDVYDLIDMQLQGTNVIRAEDQQWQVELETSRQKRKSDFELQRYGDDAWIAETHGVGIADEAIAMRNEGVTWTKDDLEWAADWHSRNPQESARVAIDEAIIQRMMKQNDEANALMGGKQLDEGLATLPVDTDENGKVITYGDFIKELEGNRRNVEGQGRGGDGPGREGTADGQLPDGGSPREAAGQGAEPTGLNETPPKPEGGVDDPRDAEVGQWVDDIIASEKILRDSDKAASDAAAAADTPDIGPLLSPFDDLPGERTLDELTEFAERPEHLAQLVEACKAV